jgi:putative ABC transport system ATP-binding protein
MSIVKLDNIGYTLKEKVHKLERTKTILSEVNLNVAHGELHLITGPSGSGKTTLLQIIATFLNQTSGTRAILGQDLSVDAPYEEIINVRSKIGYLFQRPFLPPSMKIRDFIALQAQLSGVDIVSAEDTATNMLEEFGMIDFANNYPKKLSGGEKQRVALASILAKRIKLLLLDEPTGSLDAENKDIIWKKILLQKDSGLTIIVVSHDESIKPIADVVHTLDYGKLQN